MEYYLSNDAESTFSWAVLLLTVKILASICINLNGEHVHWKLR